MAYPKLTPITATGATEPRYLGDHFADRLNVRDFGAKGDGVTDDTLSLNAAMTAAEGKTLYIPSGTYLTSTGLSIPSNTKVKGDGMWNTVVKLKDGTHYSINGMRNSENTWDHTPSWDSSQNKGNSNIVVEDICVDGNARRTATGNAGCAIQFCNVHFLKMNNIRAINGRLHCLDIASAKYDFPEDAEPTAEDYYYGASSHVYLTNIVAYDSRADDAVTTHYSHDITIKNIEIYRTIELESTTSQGLEIDDGSYRVWIDNGYVSGYNVGLQIKGHYEAPVPAHDVFVSNFICENNVLNFEVFSNENNQFGKNIILKNCTSRKLANQRPDFAYRNDLLISGHKNVFVENFIVDGKDSYKRDGTPILIASGSKNVHLSNIVLKNLDLDSLYCIRVNSTVGGNVDIKNVIVEDCHGGGVFYIASNTYINIDGIVATRTLETGETNAPVIYLTYDIFNFGASNLLVKNIKGLSGYSTLIDTPSGFQFDVPMPSDTRTEYTTRKVERWTKASGDTNLVEALCWTGAQQDLQTGEGCALVFRAKNHYNSNIYTGAYVASYKATDEEDNKSTSLVFATLNNSQAGNVALKRWFINYDGNFIPYTDNLYSVGNSASRISQLFSATGSINTSDEREKTDISDIEEKVFKAWSKVRAVVFKFKDSVKEKGSSARFHVGFVAQRIDEAFKSEGLDARTFGLFCYDKWDEISGYKTIIDKDPEFDDEGKEIVPAVTHKEFIIEQEAGDRYGIRYEEALALECAYQRWRLEQLEERVNQLTNNSNK